MEGVAAPFSDEGESVLYTRFYAEAQSALTQRLSG
jgi:hypothetical protein